MRRGNDQDILMDNDKLVGIYLGADYCAEHECGIKNIRNDFGMSNKGYGIAKRIINTLPPISLDDAQYNNCLIRYSHGQKHYLLYDRKHSIEHLINNPASEHKFDSKGHYELHLFKKYNESEPDKPHHHLSTAWDEGSFGILTDKAYKAYIDDLYQAFLNKDIAIFLGGGGVFKNAGLSICIASRIPKKHTDEWEAHDKDREKLKATAASIGIENILSKAGKKWFALAPRWAFKNIKTDYPVVYWLNPMEQRDNNSGWYSVEDLMLWAVDNGPIPKK